MGPATTSYTLKSTYKYGNVQTFLVRERDEYGEYPNIFVKVIYQGHSLAGEPLIIILSDTGTGLERKQQPTARVNNHELSKTRHEQHPEDPDTGPTLNIATFLESTLNPKHRAPYLIISTHCHYDHIGGLAHLVGAGADIKVYVSSHKTAYLKPWQHLQDHSLCSRLGLLAPQYDMNFVDSDQEIQFFDEHTREMRSTDIVVMHTPGHTPDSLCWYDRQTQSLCVGDMFYEQESFTTRTGSSGAWAREPRQPVCFTRDSSITDWSASMHRLLAFVRLKNKELAVEDTGALKCYRQNGESSKVDFREDEAEDGEWSVVTTRVTRHRISLCASHVTVETDAELALLNMLDFMLQLQLDLVPRFPVKDIEGNKDVWLWEKKEAADGEVQHASSFSVRAPWSVIHRSIEQPAKPRNRDSKTIRGASSSLLLNKVSSSVAVQPSRLKSEAVTSLSEHLAMSHRK